MPNFGTLTRLRKANLLVTLTFRLVHVSTATYGLPKVGNELYLDLQIFHTVPSYNISLQEFAFLSR